MFPTVVAAAAVALSSSPMTKSALLTEQLVAQSERLRRESIELDEKIARVKVEIERTRRIVTAIDAAVERFITKLRHEGQIDAATEQLFRRLSQGGPPI